MIVKLIAIGKTKVAYLKEGEIAYEKRIPHYMRFERIDLQDVKSSQKTSVEEVKKKEAISLLRHIKDTDSVVLLDENGTQHSSMQLAKWFEKKTMSGSLNIVFVIGGAFGFHDSVYQRANEKISLSMLTLSHQMVRMFFLEQLYRIGTIIKGEKYHHQ